MIQFFNNRPSDGEFSVTSGAPLGDNNIGSGESWEGLLAAAAACILLACVSALFSFSFDVDYLRTIIAFVIPLVGFPGYRPRPTTEDVTGMCQELLELFLALVV